MMGVVSLRCEDRGDTDAASLFRFGTMVEVDRTENGVAGTLAVMRGDCPEVEEDDDCRGRKAPTLTRVVDVPKIHKYIARRQSMLLS
jgi:hypothetical protein